MGFGGYMGSEGRGSVCNHRSEEKQERGAGGNRHWAISWKSGSHVSLGHGCYFPEHQNCPDLAWP